MTVSHPLPFTNSHLPIRYQVSFTKRTAASICKVLIDNLLKIDNCELKIASEGGLCG